MTVSQLIEQLLELESQMMGGLEIYTKVSTEPMCLELSSQEKIVSGVLVVKAVNPQDEDYVELVLEEL